MECCWFGCDRVCARPRHSSSGRLLDARKQPPPGTQLSCFRRLCRLLAQLRWARTTHALRIGREYTLPYDEIGRDYHSEICALCAFPAWQLAIMPCFLQACHCSTCACRHRELAKPVAARS
jgi:hypothetical protein